MKIFIGFENISSTVTDIAGTFKKMGHQCYTAIAHMPSKVELNTADLILSKEFDKMPIIKPLFIGQRMRNWWEHRVRKKLFEKCTSEFDVFIFLWSTFYHDFSDLEKLHKQKKKIAFIFAGDDVRWRPAASQEFAMFGLEQIPADEPNYFTKKHLERNLARIRHAEKYADIIFSRLDQSQLQLKPYYRWNMMADPFNYEHRPQQRKQNPVILHAPTSKATKGTSYIEKAFDLLKKNGIVFTPVLVENKTHHEALKLYLDADIVIDQLIIPGSGKLSSEALAMGKVVISHMAYEKYPQKNPKDCPIVDADTDTIYTVLKKLIEDHERREEIALRGRDYVNTYLHPRHFCELIEKRFEKNGDVPYDYESDFFRNSFIPEKENASLYNSWTNFVKNEEWYNKNVKTGEREGLLF